MGQISTTKMKRKSTPISRALWVNRLKPSATILLSFLCAWLFSSSISIANTQTHAQDEPLIKAAFIYNFAKFTSWPENIWQNSHAPLNLCTAGNDALVAELGQLEGKTIKQHPVSIRSLGKTMAVENCQLLYIATSEKKRYTTILKTIQKKPVLTVSELPDFENSGGIIRLYRDKKLHFIINLGAARKAGLEISSRLLEVAKVVNYSYEDTQ